MRNCIASNLVVRNQLVCGLTMLASFRKKSPLVLLLFFLFSASATIAQQKKSVSAPERAAKLTEWMKKNLQLSEEQAAKVQAINLEYAHKTEELKKSEAGKREKMQVYKKNDHAKDAELKQVLNENQYKAYQEKKGELKKKFKDEMIEANASHHQ